MTQSPVDTLKELTENELHDGMTVYVSGMTCVEDGNYIIHKGIPKNEKDDDYYFNCAAGHHWLSGQYDYSTKTLKGIFHPKPYPYILVMRDNSYHFIGPFGDTELARSYAREYWNEKSGDPRWQILHLTVNPGSQLSNVVRPIYENDPTVL